MYMHGDKPMFRDRAHAGQLLAQRLQHYADREGTLVLALPRGGAAVGDEIARALRAPLDVLIVRKLGVPGREELAMGAIALGGVQVLDEALINALGLSKAEVARVIAQEQVELSRREHVFRADRPFPALKGRAVILVDDGIATGATMAAAAHAVRSQALAHLCIAAPIAAPQALPRLQALADEIVVLLRPMTLRGIGAWYEDFSQLSDEEVLAYLQAHS
jgi:putative phosphoribosyl transferase